MQRFSNFGWHSVPVFGSPEEKISDFLSFLLENEDAFLPNCRSSNSLSYSFSGNGPSVSGFKTCVAIDQIFAQSQCRKSWSEFGCTVFHILYGCKNNCNPTNRCDWKACLTLFPVAGSESERSNFICNREKKVELRFGPPFLSLLWLKCVFPRPNKHCLFVLYSKRANLWILSRHELKYQILKIRTSKIHTMTNWCFERTLNCLPARTQLTLMRNQRRSM